MTPTPPPGPRTATHAARVWGDRLLTIALTLVLLCVVVQLAAPYQWGGSFGSTRKTVEFQITIFGKAIEAYALENRVLPATLQEVGRTGPADGEPWLLKIPLDPWGEVYAYRIVDAAAGEFVISSSGADKRPGTADDIEWSSASGFKNK